MKINWKKCNWKMFDDGLHFCKGLHEKHDACEYEQLNESDIKEIINKL